MARKRKHEEHENHERWLVSYADFITLLFAFFVVMYSLSAINEGKFRVLSESLVAAFKSTPRSPEPIQLGRPERPDLVDNPLLKSAAVAAGFERAGVALPPRPIQGPITGDTSDAAEAARERAMRDIADKVASAMAPLIEKDLVSVRRFRYWVEIEIKTNILFASGSALLDDKALPALQHVAGILKGQPNRIQVEGFTDDRPVRNLVYPSNWELSAARSMSVVHMFVREGVQPARLSAVGFGEYRPVAPNDTEEGRARNRRVVLVVFSDENNVERARDLQGTAAAVPDKKTDAPPAEAAAPDAPPDSASSRETPAAAESRGG